MSPDALKRLAALGEGPRLEFKNRVPRPDRIAREIIAFANTDGGTVLLGVDDDGTVVGLRDADEELFALDEALASRIEPPLSVRLTRVHVSRRREVVVVEVPPSDDRPHFLRPEGDPAQRRVAFVRVGEESVEASRAAVDLMKADGRGDAVHFTFGDAERRLLEYLDRFERITVREYGRLARVPPWRASRTLVTLARAGIVRLHAQPGGDDYFTAAA